MRVGVITSNNERGSSILRAHNFIKYWPDAVLCELSKIHKYDVLYIQKVHLPRIHKMFRGAIIFDLCDLAWTQGERQEMFEAADAITVSAMPLKQVFLRESHGKPVYHLPDRHDLSQFKLSKKHEGAAEWVIWYGSSLYFKIPDEYSKYIRDLGLKFKVISDKPYPDCDCSLLWDWNTIYSEIVACDITINPPFSPLKVDIMPTNKSSMSMLLNVPVAHSKEELEKLATTWGNERNVHINREEFDIRLSVRRLNSICGKYMRLAKQTRR